MEYESSHDRMARARKEHDMQQLSALIERVRQAPERDDWVSELSRLHSRKDNFAIDPTVKKAIERTISKILEISPATAKIWRG